MKFTPAGYMGPAAHTYTAGCAGHHPIGERCPSNAPAVQAATGYGPDADALHAEVQADGAKDRLIAQLRQSLEHQEGENARLENALMLARTAAREMSDEFITWTVSAADRERIADWRTRAGLDATAAPGDGA